MATMDELDPVKLSTRLVDRTKSGELKQMVLQNESKRDSSIVDNNESMKASVEQMFED